MVLAGFQLRVADRGRAVENEAVGFYAVLRARKPNTRQQREYRYTFEHLTSPFLYLTGCSAFFR